MSKCSRGLTLFFKKCDLFSSTQFLRYRGQPEYSTIVGGIASIVIICIFVALFASMGLQTAKRQIINTSMSTQFETLPGTMNVSINPRNGFMAVFGIAGIDLNDPNVSYFDVELTQSFVKNGIEIINQTVIPIEKCTSQHWNYDESLGDLYTTYLGWNWKCVPLDYNFTIGGKYTSDEWSFITWKVRKCNSTANPTCVPEAALAAIQAQIGDFLVGVGYLHTVINPSMQNYRTPVLQDRNFYPFSTNRGVIGYGYFVETQVQTDESLMPYEDIKTETFLSIPDFFKFESASVVNDTYAEINLNKGPTKVLHKRSFNKVDNYFSYVGGLIGTILGFIVILNAYAQLAYGVSMASQLFTHDDEEKISSRDFHLGYLVTVHFYRVCELLGCCLPNWPQTKAYSQCIDEVQEQLDIGYIMKRLLFFERAFSSILEPHQVEALQLHPRLTLKQAQQTRKKYELLHKIRKKQMHQQELTANESKQDMVRGLQNPDLLLPSQWGGSQREEQIQTSEELSAPQISSITDSARVRVKDSVMQVVASAEKGERVSRNIVDQMKVTLSPQLKLRKVVPLKTAKIRLTTKSQHKTSLKIKQGQNILILGLKSKLKISSDNFIGFYQST